MPSELVGFVILTIAIVAMGLLMLADRAGWRSPLPELRLSQRWISLIWVLLVVVTGLQVLRLAGTL